MKQLTFHPALAARIAAGKKTETRRPRKHTGQTSRIRPGDVVAVVTDGQNKPGFLRPASEAVCFVQITGVRMESLGDTPIDYAAEGFETEADFYRFWNLTYSQKPEFQATDTHSPAVFVYTFKVVKHGD